MFLLGLLLMAASAAFVGLLIAGNLSGGPEYTVTLLSSQPFTISVLGAFLGGVALALIFGLGTWLLTRGTALARHHSRQRSAVRGAAQPQTSAEPDVARGHLQEARTERPDEAAAPPGGRRPTATGGHHHRRRRPNRLHLLRH